MPTLDSDGWFEKSLKWVIPELRRRGYDIHSLIFGRGREGPGERRVVQEGRDLRRPVPGGGEAG